MSKINAPAFAAALLTMLVLLAMQQFPFIPLWALFISWACFFHLGGGEKPGETLLVTNIHLWTGIVASWLSALLLLANPFTDTMLAPVWGPVIIGLVIGLLVRMSLLPWLAATPAIIYGYAAVWAFLSVPGRFDATLLRFLTFDNAVIALLVASLLGTCLGYVNARFVAWLTREHATAAKSTA